MSLPDFTETFVAFVWVLANLLVCGMAGTLYQNVHKRSLLLIATACGLGAIETVLPWVRAASSSWGYWYFLNLVHIVDAVLWLVGSWLLFRDFGDLVRRFAQPGALPNGGPAEPLGNSGVSSGPPPVKR